MKKELLNVGAPAFPVAADLSTDHACDPQTGRANGFHVGMTLRDYFAAKAMQAMVSAPDVLSDMAMRADGSISSVAATAAYQMADAMLRAREA